VWRDRPVGADYPGLIGKIPDQNCEELSQQRAMDDDWRRSILSGILVIDDHPIIAKACGLVLEAAGIEGIISAGDADAGYQAFLDHEPDMSIVDLSLDGNELDGIALIKRMRSHDSAARILVFSMRSDRSSFMSAIEAGATGYLIKDSPTDEFAKAVAQTRLGRRYIDPQLALNLAFPRNAALTARERRILDLLLEDAPFPSARGPDESSH
jgi:DNA-binding NarL/FixJ family response regulator